MARDRAGHDARCRVAQGPAERGVGRRPLPAPRAPRRVRETSRKDLPRQPARGARAVPERARANAPRLAPGRPPHRSAGVAADGARRPRRLPRAGGAGNPARMPAARGGHGERPAPLRRVLGHGPRRRRRPGRQLAEVPRRPGRGDHRAAQAASPRGRRPALEPRARARRDDDGGPTDRHLDRSLPGRARVRGPSGRRTVPGRPPPPGANVRPVRAAGRAARETGPVFDPDAGPRSQPGVPRPRGGFGPAPERPRLGAVHLRRRLHRSRGARAARGACRRRRANPRRARRAGARHRRRDERGAGDGDRGVRAPARSRRRDRARRDCRDRRGARRAPRR